MDAKPETNKTISGHSADIRSSDWLGSDAFIPGSRYSGVPAKVKPGEWRYKNFRVVTKGWHWKILSACGDHHPAKSLKAAMRMIDGWHEEGSVVV